MLNPIPICIVRIGRVSSSSWQHWVFSSLLSIPIINPSTNVEGFMISEVSQKMQTGNYAIMRGSRQGWSLSPDWPGSNLRQFLMLMWLFWRVKKVGRFQSHLKEQGVVSSGSQVHLLPWSAWHKVSQQNVAGGSAVCWRAPTRPNLSPIEHKRLFEWVLGSHTGFANMSSIKGYSQEITVAFLR